MDDGIDDALFRGVCYERDILYAENLRLKEEIRIRDESQIPVVPHDAEQDHRILSRDAYPTICPTDGEGCNCDEGIGGELCDAQPDEAMKMKMTSDQAQAIEAWQMVERLEDELKTANFYRDKLAERLENVELAASELESALNHDDSYDPGHWRHHVEFALRLCREATRSVRRAV